MSLAHEGAYRGRWVFTYAPLPTGGVRCILIADGVLIAYGSCLNTPEARDDMMTRMLAKLGGS